MADQGEALVVYARGDRQWQRIVPVSVDLTIGQAIAQSGLVAVLPEIDLSMHRVGVFGKIKTLDTLVRDKDRIEIYRPLVADPKDSRRRRADHRQRQEASPGKKSGPAA